jgi:hypothetical protein
VNAWRRGPPPSPELPRVRTKVAMAWVVLGVIGMVLFAVAIGIG